MQKEFTEFKKDILEFSAKLGANANYVQGAGGNISFKEDGFLWVKASGTCLKDALQSDIYIKLNLNKVLDCIQQNISDLTATYDAHSIKKPSIETAFHALLPHKIVVHYHPVDILSYAVSFSGKSVLESKLRSFSWAWIDYVKPGIDLARKIEHEFKNNSSCNLFILQNHGLIIVGDTVSEIEHRMMELHRCFNIPKQSSNEHQVEQLPDLELWQKNGFHFLRDEPYQWLAFGEKNAEICLQKWVLYPDHIVFLGCKANYLEEYKDMQTCLTLFKTQPSYVIIKNYGVLTHNSFSSAQREYLNSFSILVRMLPNPSDLRQLSMEDANEIINWDAEKFRVQQSKSLA